MNQHDIIQDLKRVASELGHVPTRDEYIQHGKISKREICRYFENYSLALIAAGLQGAATTRSRKISNEDLFGKDISEQIETFHKIPVQIDKVPIDYPIVIAGDIHFPFSCQDTITAFLQYIDYVKPKIVVQMGDLYDMLAQSKFPKSLNVYTPKDEMDLGFKMAQDFWRKVREIVPKAQCFQIFGNHDIRPIKRIIESCPETEIFFNIDKYFTFPGVITNSDYRQELIIGDIVFHHGYLSKLGAHRDFNLMNSVAAHTHVGGVSWRNIRGRSLFELNAGYMANPLSKGLSYTPQKITRWTQGWGAIDQYGPRFISI